MNKLAVITNKPIVTVEEALEQRQELMNYIDGLLVNGVDYGSVPGTDRDVLLKPGAEKLASFLGLTPDFVEMGVTEDWTGQGHGGEPFFSYRYKCNLYKGDFKVGQGIGSCNSWEKKYRWRWIDEGELPPTANPDHLLTRKATVQEFEFAINKAETTGQYGKPQVYWDEFKAAIKADEAAKFTKKTQSGKELPAWAITTTMYRSPNEDIFSQVNTLDKMAQKRALVAAILVAASVSELFTQDLEDLSYEPVQVVEMADTKAEKTHTEYENVSPPPPPSPEDKEPNQLFPNSPETILEWLNKVEKINGFYSDTGAIIDSLSHVDIEAVPHSNDKDGWRDVFIKLRDYAIEAIIDENEIPF